MIGIPVTKLHDITVLSGYLLQNLQFGLRCSQSLPYFLKLSDS